MRMFLIWLALAGIASAQTADEKQSLLDDVDALRAKIDAVVTVDQPDDPDEPDHPADERLHTLMHGVPDFGLIADVTVPACESRTIRGDQLRSAMDVVAVHGDLTLSGDVTLKTLLVYPSGSLRIEDGSTITIADEEIDTTQDPGQWGHGIICLGDFEATGSPKTPWLRLTSGLGVGADTLGLASQPSGWQIGDRVVVTGSSALEHLRTPANRTWESTTEYRKITAISGTTVTLDEPLIHAHPSMPDNPWGLTAHPAVGNLSRSITIRSANPSGTRGHIAILGEGTSITRNVAINGMGRTKAQPGDNTTFNDDGSVAELGTNQIARYPWHAHHFRGEYEVSGCAIYDGLKWSITIHNTDDGLCKNNVVAFADGAGIACEDGTEDGNTITGNLVCDIRGGFSRGADRAGGRQKLKDIGCDGSGFWFTKPHNIINHNVAADCAGEGFNFNGYYHNIDGYKPMQSFAGNEAFGCGRSALWLTHSQGCCDSSKYHRQVVEGFTGWNCPIGLYSYHEAMLTMRDSVFVMDPELSVDYRGSRGIMAVRRAIGLRLRGYGNRDFGFSGVKAYGFNIGMLIDTKVGEGMDLGDMELHNHANLTIANEFEQRVDRSRVKFLGHSSGPGVDAVEESTFPLDPVDVFLFESELRNL